MSDLPVVTPNMVFHGFETLMNCQTSDRSLWTEDGVLYSYGQVIARWMNGNPVSLDLSVRMCRDDLRIYAHSVAAKSRFLALSPVQQPDGTWGFATAPPNLIGRVFMSTFDGSPVPI